MGASIQVNEQANIGENPSHKSLINHTRGVPRRAQNNLTLTN